MILQANKPISQALPISIANLPLRQSLPIYYVRPNFRPLSNEETLSFAMYDYRRPDSPEVEFRGEGSAKTK